MEYTLLSTVVAPSFSAGSLSLVPITSEAELVEKLAQVTDNLCGHPVTSELLTSLCPSLPEAHRAFWNGSTAGIAVRPRGGVRNAVATGDTKVLSFDDIEAVVVTWTC